MIIDHTARFWLGCMASFAVLAGCSPGGTYPQLDAVQDRVPDKVSYNWHVRPILSDTCFGCHGPQDDAKAGLRLASAETAYAALRETPDRVAIAPGNPSASEMIRRILADDPDEVMPPPQSHLKLSDVEKATLVRWVEQGAEYEPHWAFIPPRAVEPPVAADDTWSQGPIDRFIWSRLAREGIAPSPAADRETLLRRATFDLTGLPPTLAEIDDFLANDEPGAYERVLDRLLASPAYGERMAAPWMDVARYADSDGYLDDKHRVVHPWRDWVIEAFNRNLPYDDFVTWQLAGDLLPEARQEQVLATAFNRLHKRNSEAGIDYEEYRVAYVADRTDTFGTAFLGMSVGCARCHDHKYDPIAHRDYYSIFSFFNSTNELGSAIYGPEQTPGPSLLLTRENEDAAIADLTRRVEMEETALAKVEREAIARALAADKTDQSVDIHASLASARTALYSFEQDRPFSGSKPKFADHAVDTMTPNTADPATPARLFEPVFGKGVAGRGFVVGDYNFGALGNRIGWYDRTDAFSLSLWVRPARVHEEASVLMHSEELRLGLKGYSIVLHDNRPRFIMSRAWPTNAFQVTAPRPLPVNEWSHIAITYDGSSRAAGVRLYVDGREQAVSVDIDSLYKTILFQPDIHTYGFEGLTIGEFVKIPPFKDGTIDEISVYDRALTSLEVSALYGVHASKAPSVADAVAANAKTTMAAHVAAFDADVVAQRERTAAAREALNQRISTVPEIMVMGDAAEPRPTFVLARGDFGSPTDPVSPGTPNAILPFPKELPANRLGLARWLFDPAHPLTARVFVNRIWQMHFGRGLVSTPDDFGNQGSLPSHPELLDWLALRFRDSGWNIKALHKDILMSAAYRQSSVARPELAEIDPENMLIARGPSHRLPAEMIRDGALAASGLLVRDIGGESQYPYQPAGLWDELSNKHWRYRYPDASTVGDGLFRRSLYTVWKRTSPPPSMMIFDASGRDHCVVQRARTSTPLQALTLLNDVQFVEASRVLAERAMQESPPAKRIDLIFRRALGRSATAQEHVRLDSLYDELRATYQAAPEDALALLREGETPPAPASLAAPAEAAALAVVANTVMNTHEAFTKR